MIEARFLGIEISDEDDYGSILLRLSLDLLASIRKHESDQIVKDKAKNIIEVCTGPAFEQLVDGYEWFRGEVEYAEKVLVECQEVAVVDILHLARRRLTLKNKQRHTDVSLSDLKLGAMMAYFMMLPKHVCGEIEDNFIKRHGAIHFRRS